MSDYLEGLNEAQRKAVEQTEGAVMVIAGAGSGKTRVLTYRIAHLIQKGVSPFNILALTFTNKAAREMKERIASVVGETKAKSLWMGTFHSVFAKILRVESEKIGYPSNFTIYDTDDAKRLLKEIIKERGLDDKVYKPNLVLSRISSAKNNLISAAAYNQNLTLTKEDAQSKKPELAKIYSIYEKKLFKAGAMDFDDLLFKTNILLRDFPDVLLKYQDKFRYIMVDEYQDTNFSQYVIVRALAARFQNICVVGDDAQSIYAFRGANIQNILNFQKDYSDAKILKLEQNYRSTQNIVDAANSIIAKNLDQLKKNVWTSNTTGNKLKVSRHLSDNEEALSVAYQIKAIESDQQASPSDFAILYRTNAQSRAAEDALRKLNIPYQIYGGLSFYQRKEIKDLLAYFRLVINPQDEDALKRIINYPTRGIGKTSFDKIVLYGNQSGMSLWDIISQIHQAPIPISAAVRNKIQGFAEMVKGFQAALPHKDAYEVASQIASITGILKELHSDKTAEGVSKYDNLQELLNSIKEFTQDEAQEQKDLATFTIDLPLLTDKDDKKEDDSPKVTLLTIHASKGLEYPYIFIVGMEENLFPSQLSVNSRADLEEERRLFYVAITRAEKQCYLSYATSRYKWGNLIHCEPSRFLEELDPRYLEFAAIERRSGVSKGPVSRPSGIGNANNQERSTQTNTASKFVPKRPKSNFVSVSNANTANFQGDDTSSLKAGMQVEHARFGPGKVTNIEGPSDNKKATIFFKNVGQKQLLLKFAKLKIVD